MPGSDLLSSPNSCIVINLHTDTVLYKYKEPIIYIGGTG